MDSQNLSPSLDEGWFDVLLFVAARSAEDSPFATYALLLMTLVFIILVPTYLTYSVLRHRILSNERIEFEKIRLNGKL